MQSLTFDRLPTVRPSLNGHARVALDELEPAARILISSLRAAASPRRLADGDTAGEQGGLASVITKFVVVTRDYGGGPAATVPGDGPQGLTAFEAHTLHATACVQRGLLGEAWQTLAQVCPSACAGQALLRLEEIAALLTRRGDRLTRWRFEQDVAPSPGRG
jgi:hypothetical protein